MHRSDKPQWAPPYNNGYQDFDKDEHFFSRGRPIYNRRPESLNGRSNGLIPPQMNYRPVHDYFPPPYANEYWSNQYPPGDNYMRSNFHPPPPPPPPPSFSDFAHDRRRNEYRPDSHNNRNSASCNHYDRPYFDSKRRSPHPVTSHSSARSRSPPKDYNGIHPHSQSNERSRSLSKNGGSKSNGSSRRSQSSGVTDSQSSSSRNTTFANDGPARKSRSRYSHSTGRSQCSGKDNRHSEASSKHSSRKRKSSDDSSDDDVSKLEPALDIEEEIKSLTSNYLQCTQHGNMYKRIMQSDSTVVGTEKLQELYDRFEKQLANRHKSLRKPNHPTSPSETLSKGRSDEAYNVNKSVRATLEKVKAWNLEKPLTRHQRVKSSMTVKKLAASASKMQISLEEYIKKMEPSIPIFTLRKLKEALESGVSNFDSDIEEDGMDGAGEQINNIRKLKAHPDRLHDELWYNELNQANDGPLCHCSPETRCKGIRHNIYPGESQPPSCHQMENNIGKLYHYRVMVGPAVNFMSPVPTSIKHNDHDYMFEGFSIFSHEPLLTIPYCDIIRFHIRYTIFLIEETPPENFCMRGLELFHQYLFREVLELYDWEKKDDIWPENTETENFRKFRFYPRFVRSLPDNGKEVLSLCKVLEYLMENDKPLVAVEELDHLMKCSHNEWLEYTEKVRGMIVTYPGKKPSSLRVDQLDRYDRKPVESASSSLIDDRYPMIVHFGIRPANLCYAGDPTYQRIWRSYLKLRHLMANSPRVKPSDKKKLREREQSLQKIRRAKDMQREVTVEVSSCGFRRTGIFSDICQHAMLLPVLTHHLRYHLCLSSLENKIGYHFKERKWLSHAMNHPSCQMNFGLNPDQVRNALSNCGLRLPKYGDSSIHYKYTRKRGITILIRIMARLGQQRPVLSPIEHNERLEFLGDAVVGYFTSVHLFHLFPDLSEGALTTFRTVLVNNQHLALLAERLQLDEYMLYAHVPDLCRKADLGHAMANCFEALMGAIYMEAGLDTAKELFGKFLWETVELQNIWKNLPLHPLQEEEPISDRHYIKDIPILQKLTKFEESIGVEYNHIRLLAKAFTWRNVHENILTHGHNQRLEFLGDSICNLVASTYLFKLYPTHHEGHLTLLRATIVNGRTQSLVATELGMADYVICTLTKDYVVPSGRKPDWTEKNLADLLEAFVASLFIDKGLKYVEGFMKVCFFPRLKEFILTQGWNDPKSCLQQCCLTLRQEGKEPQLPTYEISHQTGPSHARKYIVSVYFNGKEIGKGKGESIQRAERNAARVALNEYNFPQLEWQRRYVAKKHDLPYQPRKNLKKIDHKPDSPPPTKKGRLEDES